MNPIDVLLYRTNSPTILQLTSEYTLCMQPVQRCPFNMYSCTTLKNIGLHVMLMYIQTFDWTIICGGIIL